MTLRARLALGFLTIALLLAVPLATALFALGAARDAAERVQEEALAGSIILTRISAATADVRRAEALVAVNKGDTASAGYFDRSLAQLPPLVDSLASVNLGSLAVELKHSVGEIAKYGPIEIAALQDSETVIADNVADDHVRPAIASLERQIAQADTRIRNLASGSVNAAIDEAENAERLAMFLFAAAIILSALVAYWLTRSISRPVRDLERGMEVVAGGKFTHQLTVGPGRDDEFGRLAASFQSMTDQLAELDKLKAEFVSVASHELKTPINVIMGYLKLLEENLYGPMNTRQAEVVGIMQTQSAALARLVQHLLDVSRFQAGAARLDAMPMTLRGFLQQLEATYEVLAMQRGITFSIVTAESLPEVVTWDIDRINEVLGNLLSNAFKFTEAGGRVDLVVSSIEESVYIEVRDTGVGIAAAQMPHIFDKFFQADNQKGAGAKGSGLGLAISKEIVEAHGGSIAAESTVGVGTKFSIMLPVSATPPNTPGHTAPSSASATDAAGDAAEPHAAGATA